MALLLAAVLAFAGGPLLERTSRRAGVVIAALEGLLLVTILGLVGLDLLPELIGARDWIAGACLLAGVVAPTVLERGPHRAVVAARSLLAALALVGTGMHQLADGSALRLLDADAGNDRAQLMAVGVAAHQLPVGLAMAWSLRHRSWQLTVGVFIALVSCTVAGFVLAEHLVLSPAATRRALALVAGFVLHVLVHDRPLGRAGAAPQTLRRAEGWGALAGVLLLVVMTATGRIATDPRLAAIGRRFLDLLLESAPALVLAYLVTGMLSVFAPAASREWIGRGSRLTQAAKGIVVGLPLPLCSCSVVPLYQRLSARRGSVVGATAFLIAGPELGLDAMLMSLPLLGGPVAVLRVVSAVVVALAVALLMGHLLARRVTAVEPVAVTHPAERLRWPAGLARAIRIGFGDALGHTAPWILVGLASAALLGPTPATSWLASLPPGWQVVALTLAGMPAYICASAATPLVAALGAGGVSMGAGIAFLITGPATNVTTFGVVARQYGRRMAVIFLAAVCGLAMTLGLAISALWPEVKPPPPRTTTLEGHSALHVAAAALFVLATARVVVRRGLRAFLAELRPSRSAGHDHAAGGAHGTPHHAPPSTPRHPGHGDVAP